MCGIVGILGDGPVAARLLDGLKRLEYRGYDSAGIATLYQGEIQRRRSVGKIFNLAQLLNDSPLSGRVGIGHTRWATHGSVNTENTHPHSNENIVLVHNGIIENSYALKEKLVKEGYIFETETDTEVILHLITQQLKHTSDPLRATQAAIEGLEGAYSLLVLFRDFPDIMIGVRQGCPLVLGVDERELFFGSDALSICPWTSNIIYLEDGDIVLGRKGEQGSTFSIFDRQGHQAIREIKLTSLSTESASKGEYSHFMLKEIYEQPQAIIDTLKSYIHKKDSKTFFHTQIEWNQFQQIKILACGTSYYAGLVAQYWFEKIARIQTSVEIASEFRYREPYIHDKTLAIFISQSGETIDTLEALKHCQLHELETLAIVNVTQSSIARMADHVFTTTAGPEIGVASTKAYTAQLLTLAILCLQAGGATKNLSDSMLETYIDALTHVPRQIQYILNSDNIPSLSHVLLNAQTVLYLGRGVHYPTALEGALKLKELSYIHAEGYPAGELKHGPIALIDHRTPVIAILPFDQWYEKTLSNIEQVLARGAIVICLTDAQGAQKIEALKKRYSLSIYICPSSTFITAPIIYAVPVQLIAYYTALQKGTDVDQPRNLAKSVTVE